MGVSSAHDSPVAPAGPPDSLPQDPDDFRAVAYASAIGNEFDFDLLADAMGTEPEALSERVERLVERGVLRERPGGGRFAFADDSVRARIYQSMIESRLRVIHLKIAESLERRNPHPGPEVVAELGRHFFLGRSPQKAWRYNLEAAGAARDNNRPEAALHDLERARRDLLSLPGEHARDLAIIEEETAHLQRALGRPAEAAGAYLRALARVPLDDRKARLRLLLARAESVRAAMWPESAADLAEQALALAQATGDLRSQAMARRLLGRTARDRGDYTHALDEAMAALDLLQRVGDRRAIGECSTDIALSFGRLGPSVQDEALRWSRRSVEILDESGDRRALVRALVHLAMAEGVQDPHAALDELTRARAIAEELGLPAWTLRTLLGIAELQVQVGAIEDAGRSVQLAHRTLERVIDPIARQQLTMTEGVIAERHAHWEEAEAAYTDAIRQAQLLGLSVPRAESEFRLARLRFKTRDLAGARAAFAQAEAGQLGQVRPSLAGALEELRRQLDGVDAGSR